MTKKHRFKMDKLARDKSEAWLNAKGVFGSYRVMDTKEYIQRLKYKLLEEVEEIIEAKTDEEFVSECADLLEVVHAFANAKGLSYEQIERKRIHVKEDRGGFDERIYQEYVEVDADNERIEYFRSNPDKYHEIK